MRERLALAALLGLALLLCWSGPALACLPLPGLLAGVILLAVARPARAGAEPDGGDFLPFVSLVIPARDEERVIAAAVEAALGQDYAGGFEVLAVNDGSRDSTGRVLQGLQRQHPELRLLHRKPRPGDGKGGALQAATALCRGELVAVLDADARVAPDFLSRMVPWLAPAGVGAVQCRKRVREPAATWLHRLQADESALIVGLQLDRSRGGGAVDLMGNGMVIKRHALADAGGWEAAALTEDLDLGTRLHARGWEVRYAHGPVVWEEPATSWTGLYRQRRRWAEGSYRRYCRHFWAMLAPQMTVAKTWDMLCFLGALVLPLGTLGGLLGQAAGVPLDLYPLGWVALLALLLTPLQVARALYRDGERRPLVLLGRGLLVTGYLTAIWTPTVLVALARIIMSGRPSDWVKSEHGLDPPQPLGRVALEEPACR